VANRIVVVESSEQISGMLRSAGLAVQGPVRPENLAPLDPLQPPNVLVIDARGEPGLPTEVGAFRRRHPSIGMVVVASSHDPTLLLEAMRAGASEFFVHLTGRVAHPALADGV